MREVLRLRSLVERLLETRRPLSREDMDRLGTILPAVAGAWESESFASRDLATNAGVRVVLRGLSIKQVGKLLSRGAGIPINGLMIEGPRFPATSWRRPSAAAICIARS